MASIRRSSWLVLALMTGTVSAEQLTGKVVGVHTGDTITVLDQANRQHTVRIGGIDAPGLKQDFGNAAKKSLADMVHDKPVVIEWHTSDRYGRLIGKVLTTPADCSSCPANRDVGLAQLEAGMAWWNREFKKEQTLSEQGYYEYAEYASQRERRGLWQGDRPMAPWEWRKRYERQREM